MSLALLANERALRAKLAKCITGVTEVAVEEYPTAAKALAKLSAKHYDLVALHWQVYPGLGSGDSHIDQLASLIPHAKLNRNLLYWEVGLRVIDMIREEDCPNRTTPVVVMLPELGRSVFCEPDVLTRDAVERAIAARQPAEAVYGPSPDRFAKAVARQLDAALK